MRVALAALITVSTVLGFSYELIASEPISYDSFNIIWDAKSHARGAWRFYQDRIVLVLVVSIVGFLAIAIVPKTLGQSRESLILSTKWYKARRAFYVARPVIAILPIVAIFTISLFRGGAGTGGLPVQYKVPGFLALTLINNSISSQFTREQIPIPVIREAKQPHVVLIVDESVRGDFIDLNFNRGVTPGLYEYRDRAVNFGYSLSSTNCSTGSNIVFRMGATSDDLLHDLRTNPYIWSYAAQAGYRTILIQTQEEGSVLDNNLSTNEANTIDEIIYAKGLSPRERDLNAARIIKNKLKDSRPSFIYVNKAGTHFPYEGAYMQQEALYSPNLGTIEQSTSAFKMGTALKDKALMINSYKNAIQLSVDRFFVSMLSETNFENTVIIYTSDHGQNLLDTDIEITHCTTINTTPYEALVPLIIFTDVKKWRQQFEAGAKLNFNQTSHFNIIPTILNILGYDDTMVTEKHGQNLFDYIDSPDLFVSGIAYYDFRLNLGERNTLNWNKGIKELVESLRIGNPD